MISREKLVIPTYEMEEAEKSPIFYDVRNHQGTRGNVYPIPMRDVFLEKKIDREYDSVRLENDYVRIVVLPELGGRIYEGYDKRADYHFVYKNHVIKPALIGLAGAWVSGGIEFNWPQHHRPTTYMPVDCRIERGEDGSETAWMGEYEPLFGMKCLIGVTIWPDRAYVTVRTRLYNPTNATQTFHWWANLAVAANESYQLKFPPDIDYITYHNKDAVSEFPVVKGEFARAEFGDGQDITWFRNIPSPASFFIFNSNYNFMGGYDHGQQRGTVHVADHHVSVGKKFFTWGSRAFGDAWHKNLTDEDGAYLEIMTGCYTDNQPDFAFLAPDETKVFEQTWYALTDMPDLKNAEKEGAVGFSLQDGELRASLNVTSEQPGARLWIAAKGKVLLEETVSLTPGTACVRTLAVPEGVEEKDISIQLTDREGETIIGYTWRPPFFADREKPEPRRPARKPEEIESPEELYLEGLHLEKYRHVTLRAEPYYLEGLRRDPGDSRCANAMGMLRMKQGRPREALSFFRTAVQRHLLRDPNPRDGELYFNLGWALEEIGDEEEAVRCYRKAAWNSGFKAAGLRQAAKAALRKGKWKEALSCLEEAFPNNAESPQISFLLSFVFRRLGRRENAELISSRMLSVDPLAYSLLAESWLLTGEEERLRSLCAVLGEREAAWRTLLSEYAEIGAWEDLLKLAAFAPPELLILLYQAYAAQKLDREQDTREFLRRAQASSLDRVFPYTDWDVRVLRCCRAGGLEARCDYLLGCLFYGRDSREEGIRLWQQAAEEGDLHQAHRCLALALMDEYGDLTGARCEMERAFRLEQAENAGKPQDGRYLLELLAVRKRCGEEPEKLLALLEQYPETVNRREDLAHQRLVLCNEAGHPEKTAEYLAARSFHPYEGGEGILIRAHMLAYVQLGRRAAAQGKLAEAVSCYETALTYPENYHEGRSEFPREAAVCYYMARAMEAMGENEKAREWDERAAACRTGLLDESDFYTGCALRRLGRNREAALLYREMLEGARKILREEDRLPYFGGFVSNLPGEHSVRIANHRKAHPALFYALTGLSRTDEAQREKELAKQWGAEIAWISIVEAEGKEFLS